MVAEAAVDAGGGLEFDVRFLGRPGNSGGCGWLAISQWEGERMFGEVRNGTFYIDPGADEGAGPFSALRALTVVGLVGEGSVVSTSTG